MAMASANSPKHGVYAGENKKWPTITAYMRVPSGPSVEFFRIRVTCFRGVRSERQRTTATTETRNRAEEQNVQ